MLRALASLLRRLLGLVKRLQFSRSSAAKNPKERGKNHQAISLLIVRRMWRTSCPSYEEKKMKSLKKLAIVLALVFPVLGANAQRSIGYASTFNGLTWIFSTNVPGATGCTVLLLDMMGDMFAPSALAVHGGAACNNNTTSYGITGTLNKLVNGLYGVTMYMGANVVYTCSISQATLNGSCTAYNSAGVVTGSATMTLF
jgi:hypothetical protein